MTSRIDPTTIDATYPIAGQDNDTAGFHNNYLAVPVSYTHLTLPTNREV